MNQTKKCLICEKTIKKPQNESQLIWETKHKYCSRKCTYKGLSIRYKRSPNSGTFKKGRKTWNKGIEYRQIRGEKHWNWQGGKARWRRYVGIRQPDHPNCDSLGYVKEHRLVMEKNINRYLMPQEVVHHINGDKKDNRLGNLMLFPNNGEHTKFHYRNYLKSIIS